MKLTIKIKAGNAAVLTSTDIADILRESVADSVASILGEYENITLAGPFGIYDYNGNRVGEWEIK